MVAGRFGSRNYAGDILNHRRQRCSVLTLYFRRDPNGVRRTEKQQSRLNEKAAQGVLFLQNVPILKGRIVRVIRGCQN